MIKNFLLEQFGPLERLRGDQLGNINLFIGANGCGKTFLLKALYTMVRSAEEYRRGEDRRSFEEVLSDKLYWTFQVDKLGELVQKGKNQRLKATFETQSGHTLAFEMGAETQKKIPPARIIYIPETKTPFSSL